MPTSRFILPLACVLLLAASLSACGASPAASKGPLHTAIENTDDQIDPVDLSTLTASSVVAYRLGSLAEPTPKDLAPLMSEGEAYNEKWEFVIYGHPYEMRIKFEVANLGFGDFKGRASGRVKKRIDGVDIDVYSFKRTFARGKWHADKDAFAIEMGPWKVTGEPGNFHLTGVAGKDNEVRFDITAVGQTWRPGTGLVFFGADAQEYFKSTVLLTQGQAHGTVEIDGVSHATKGRTYGNHLATNIGAHEMADKLYHFRLNTDDLFVEWRHIETTERFDHTPYGFLVISYQGTILFESTEVEMQPLAYWTDPEGYGYAVPNGVLLTAKDGDASLQLVLGAGEIEGTDPLASLPALERAVAVRFAQPMDYKVKGPLRLDLKAFGEHTTVEMDGSYTVTVMR